MTDIMKVNETWLLFGLEWQIMDIQKRNMGAIVRAAYLLRNKRGAIVFHGDRVALGISDQKGRTYVERKGNKEKPKNRMPKGIAFAARLANEYSSAIAAVEISDDTAIAVHVANGLVLAGRDVTGTPAVVRSAVAEWVQFSAETLLIGSPAMFPGESKAKSMSLADIAEPAVPNQNIGLTGNLAARLIFGFYRFELLGLTAVSLVAVILYRGVDVEVPILTKPPPPDPIKIFYDTRIRPLMNRPVAAGWAVLVHNQIQGLPRSLNAWMLMNIKCVSTKQECNARYENKTYSTNKEFDEYFERVKIETLYSDDGKTATARIPLPPPLSSEETGTTGIAPTDYYAQLPLNDEFMVDSLSTIQQGVMSGIMNYKVSGGGQSVLGAAGLPLYQRKWTLSSGFLFYLIEGAALLDKRSFLADELTISFKPSSENWQFSGMYIHR